MFFFRVGETLFVTREEPTTFDDDLNVVEYDNLFQILNDQVNIYAIEFLNTPLSRTYFADLSKALDSVGFAYIYHEFKDPTILAVIKEILLAKNLNYLSLNVYAYLGEGKVKLELVKK